MFPTPAIRSCASRKALTGARRPRARARSASAVKSSPSGSTPSREAKYVVAGVGAEQDDTGAEAAHVGEHQALAGVQVHPDARVAGLLRTAGEEQVAGHPQVHHEEDLVLELEHQVLAAPGHPLDAPAPDGVLELDRARRARTSARRAPPSRCSVLPSRCGASWRRIVSTSGSSGKLALLLLLSLGFGGSAPRRSASASAAAARRPRGWFARTRPAGPAARSRTRPRACRRARCASAAGRARSSGRPRARSPSLPPARSGASCAARSRGRAARPP